MKKTKILFLILLALLGIFLFVFGEYDDSPGGQLLGAVLVAISIVSIVKSWKKIK